MKDLLFNFQLCDGKLHSYDWNPKNAKTPIMRSTPTPTFRGSVGVIGVGGGSLPLVRVLNRNIVTYDLKGEIWCMKLCKVYIGD